jgi:hypothetical protein
MNDHYLALSDLRKHSGYAYLEELWMLQQAKIEEGRDKAAKKNNESAWRYWAGQEAGFKLATTQLVRALMDLEKEDENLTNEDKITKMLDDLRSKQGESK